eukprot:Tbor_TRINITY_DN5011_c0_g2::TRINITY_DN5011_c0_g2_i1::g.14372::m.14372
MNSLLSTGIFSLICNYIDDSSAYAALCLTSRKVKSVANRACTFVEMPLSLVTSMEAERDDADNILSSIPRSRCLSLMLSTFEFKVSRPEPNLPYNLLTSTIHLSANKLFLLPHVLITRNEIEKEEAYDSDGWHSNFRFSFCQLRKKLSLYMSFFKLVHHLIIENFRGVIITELLPLFPNLKILEIISHTDDKSLQYEDMTTISVFTPESYSVKSAEDNPDSEDFNHRHPLEKLVLGWKLDDSFFPTVVSLAQYSSIKHLIIYEATDEFVQDCVKPLCSSLELLEVKSVCPTVPSAFDIMSLPHLRQLRLTGVAKDYSSHFSIDLNLLLLPNLLECELKYISITGIILPKPGTNHTGHRLQHLSLDGCMIYLYGDPIELPQCKLSMTDCWVAKGGHFCVKSFKHEDVVGEGIFTMV